MSDQVQNDDNQKQINHGENIRYYRTLIKLSLIKAAERAEVEPLIFAGWEDSSKLEMPELELAAKALNIGVEYLLIHIDRGNTNIFSQDGNQNHNFQKNDNMTVHITNPLEAVEKAYDKGIDVLEKSKQEIITLKNEQIALLSKELESLKKDTL